jgi:hypothetical protein
MQQPESVRLSVIVTIVSGAGHLPVCLSALLQQQDCSSHEIDIIVPYDARDTRIATLQQEFPTVRFEPVTLTVEGPAGLCHEHFDELRAAGLRIAHGAVVALLEDHEQPAPDWCSRLLAAHRLPHAAIGGAVENAVDRPLNWAVYFLDFGRYQNPLTAGPSGFLTDVNIGYKHSTLQALRPVWEQQFSEPALHGALQAAGHTLWLSPDVVVYQRRTGLTLAHAMRERYVWGRFFAGNRIQGKPAAARLAYSIMCLAVPGIILLKKIRDILQKRRHGGAFLRALPFTLLLILCWTLGELVGYVTASPSSYHRGVAG